MLNNIVRIVVANNQKNGMFGMKLAPVVAQNELVRILNQPQIVNILQRMKHN